MQQAVQVVDSAEQAAVLLEPVRLRILERLREPDSSVGVARALGMPRQRIGHHVRTLEASGLLTPVGERRRRNCVERLLQVRERQLVGSGGNRRRHLRREVRLIGRAGCALHPRRRRKASDFFRGKPLHS